MILLFNQILSMMPQSAGYFRAQVSLWDFPVCIMEMISKKTCQMEVIYCSCTSVMAVVL